MFYGACATAHVNMKNAISSDRLNSEPAPSIGGLCSTPSSDNIGKLLVSGTTAFLAILLGMYLLTRYEIIPAEKEKVLAGLPFSESQSMLAREVLDCSFEKAFLEVTGTGTTTALLRSERRHRPECWKEVVAQAANRTSIAEADSEEVGAALVALRSN